MAEQALALREYPQIIELLAVLEQSGLTKEREEVSSLVEYIGSMEEKLSQMMGELQEMHGEVQAIQDKGAGTSMCLISAFTVASPDLSVDVYGMCSFLIGTTIVSISWRFPSYGRAVWPCRAACWQALPQVSPTASSTISIG